ncbi:MAG TPA: PsiF repeat-containing protein [Thauera sp.]|nr:PsiF repeat-containing protein [Thauera sp.]HHW63950.1 PsiF repeat-containing protein [Rhodocyclaceae bacterium]
MKTIVGAVCASLALMALSPAQAWANPQHERMKRCNAEAKEQVLKGDERKAFMSNCLRGRHAAGVTGDTPAAAPAASAPAPVPAAAEGDGAGGGEKVSAAGEVKTALASTEAESMSAEDLVRKKACNQSATEQSLRGSKRKAFIAECMKG